MTSSTIRAVRTEIVDEARSLGDLVLLDTQMFDDDLLHPIAVSLMEPSSVCLILACPSSQSYYGK